MIKNPEDLVSEVLLDKADLRFFEPESDTFLYSDWWISLLEKTTGNTDYDTAATMLIIIANYMPDLPKETRLSMRWLAEQIIKKVESKSI